MNIDLKELLRLALDATGGKKRELWTILDRFPCYIVPASEAHKKLGGACDPVVDEKEYALVLMTPPSHTNRLSKAQDEANAAFVAAANPAVLLHLLDTIASLSGGLIEEELHVNTYQPVLRASLPDDIRAQGWMVGCHNDYTLMGEKYTFWLFTKGSECVRGEGRDDKQAMNTVRRQLNLPEL